MKKEKMITRTIVSTLADVKIFNVSKAMVEDKKVVIVGKIESNDVADSITLADDEKFIMVNTVEYIEKLYGVTESAFLAIAVELPPRTKADEAEEG